MIVWKTRVIAPTDSSLRSESVVKHLFSAAITHESVRALADQWSRTNMATGASTKTRSRANGAGSSGSLDTEEEETVTFSQAQEVQLAKLIAEAMKATDTSKKKKTGARSGANGHAVSDSEDGEVSTDEAEAYMQNLGQALEEGEKTGRALPDDIIRVFNRAVGSPMDAKLVKEKRDLFPRPANAPTLKTPALNDALEKSLSTIGVKLDKKLQDVQKNMTAAMAAVATQATFMWDFKDYIKSGVVPQLKEQLPLVQAGFVTLMDANILLTRALSDATHARREAVKLTLNKEIGAVLSDKNPATPEWLGGPDLTAEIDRVEKEKKDIAKMKHFTFPNTSFARQGNTDNSQQQHGHKNKSSKSRSYQKDNKKKPYNSKKKYPKDKEDFHRRGTH